MIMTKHLRVSALSLFLTVSAACGGGDGGGGTDAGNDVDAGGDTDAGHDAGPVCVAPVDGNSVTFLNQGACGDSRVECESFDNTRIPVAP